MIKTYVRLLVCLGCSLSVCSADWPQGAGPSASYVTDGEAPREWSVVSGKNIVWAHKLPETGQSTVVCSAGRLFYTCYQKLKGDSELASEIVAYCADAETGEVIWERNIPGEYPLRLSGCFADSTSPPPVTDGERVCFFNASGGITCFDLDGNQKWSRNLMAVARSQPFVVDGMVIYTKQMIMPKEGKFGHENENAPRDLWTQLEALELKTGSSAWISECGVNMGAIPMLSRLSDGKEVIVLGRGGGHSPPEKPLGVSMIEAATGKTLWTLSLDRFMSTQTYPVAEDHALIFHGPEHLWVNRSGRVDRRVNFCEGASVRRWNGETYVDSVEDLNFKPSKGRAITQQSNLLIGDYHYFRAYGDTYLGRIHIQTGEIEYLQLPVQVLRNKNQADRLVWSLNESSFIPADMKNNDGFLVMGDRRSRTNTWGHHASPIMTVVGSHLYIPTMSGTVYCIDWNVGSLDENAILSINDLGVAGSTWTRSSISFDSGKLYARTIKQLICIGTN